MNTFLPSIHAGADATLPPVHCNMSVRALTFVYLWMDALQSRATLMRCDVRLVNAATLHAQYLAGRTPEQLLQSPHLSADGSTPNQRVRASGYALPPEYPIAANNCESYFGGNNDPARALERLLESPPHRTHLLCAGGFAAHVMYAVACSHDGGQWVVLTAPEES